MARSSANGGAVATEPLRPPLQLVDLFRSYFEGALEEGSVKRNFTLIYELLDEAMDFGFPQVCVCVFACVCGGGGGVAADGLPGARLECWRR
jgi:hypothetical protein